MTQLADTWYDSSSVRGRPRRIVAEDRDDGLLIFPESLVRHLDHEAVTALGPQARTLLLTQHFYQYMFFTTHLETKVVNRGAALISHGEVDLIDDPRTRLDALKIYCDEGYHALFSLDIVQQVEEELGIAALAYDFGPRLARLGRTADDFLPEHQVLAQLLQVVAFETVVTTLLSQIPYDSTVHRVVRGVVGDHLRDEVHHHAFFVKYFKELWANLDPALRTSVACAMPHFINDCLRPDLEPIHAALCVAGLSDRVAADVIDDCYREEVLTGIVVDGGRHALRLCQFVGAFDIPRAREQLDLLGLTV